MLGGTGTVSSGFPAGFSGIDPDLMDRMINVLRHKRSDLSEFVAAYRGWLAGLQVDTSAFVNVDRVGGWIDAQIPMLQERQRLAVALDDSSEPGLVPVSDSSFLPPGEARRQGKALAEQVKKAGGGAYTQLINQLADHQYDPEYAAAFFAALGPELTRRLPSLIRKYGEHGKVGYLIRSTSAAFGSAVSGGRDVPGFDNVIKPMSGPLSGDDREGVAALVCAGKFPPEWLAELVKTQVLRPLYAKTDTPATLSWPSIESSDSEAYRLFLRALGNNPEASRLAFTGVAAEHPNPSSPLEQYLMIPPESSLPRTLAVFTRLAQTDPKVAEQLGRAYAAASGAYDERDGHHSKAAGSFAFTVMTTMPHVTNGVPEAMKRAMSQIAGAYATEITEGANGDDRRENQVTAFKPVKSAIPGLNPMFGLSPKDTYLFLKTFADTDEDMKPFEQGMGALTRRLVAEGVRLEKLRQQGKISSGTPGLERIMASLGYVSGLQLQAEKQVRGKLDAQDLQSEQLIRKMIGLGIDYGSVFLPGFGPVGGELLSEWAWETIKQYNSQALDSLTSGGETRIAKLNDKTLQQTLASEYSMVKLLMAAHYKMKVSPQELLKPENADKYGVQQRGVSFLDQNGNLLPYDQIANNSRALDNFITWLEVNGRGGNDEDAFGQVAVSRSATLLGDRTTAEAEAQKWEQEWAKDPG
jgi:hypothetical protein